MTCRTLVQPGNLPPRGMKLKLVEDKGGVIFCEPEKTPEIRLSNGTKVVFDNCPFVLRKNGSEETLPRKTASVCTLDAGNGRTLRALLFPGKILLLSWFTPGQTLRAFTAREGSSIPFTSPSFY